MNERPNIKYKPARGNAYLDAVCEAIRASHGLITPAAKRLGVDASNLRKFIRLHAKAQAAKVAGENALLDFTKHKLYELMERGDFRAISFYLACKGGFTPPKDGNAGDTNVTNVTIQSVKITSVPSGVFLPPLTTQLERSSLPMTIDHEDTRTAADL